MHSPAGSSGNAHATPVGPRNVNRVKQLTSLVPYRARHAHRGIGEIFPDDSFAVDRLS
jgi:hypothetical protein